MSYQNDHVGAGALPSSNTTTNSQIVQQTIRNLIGITPAGAFCLLCNTAFKPGGWRSHFNNKHPDISKTLPNRLEDIIRILDYQVQEANKGNVSLYAKSNKVYNKLQCSGCSSIFRDQSHTKQHYKSTRNNCSAIMHPCARIPCIQFKCGRFHPAPNQPKEQLVTANTNVAQQVIYPTQQATALTQYAVAVLPSQAEIGLQPALRYTQYFSSLLSNSNRERKELLTLKQWRKVIAMKDEMIQDNYTEIGKKDKSLKADVEENKKLKQRISSSNKRARIEDTAAKMPKVLSVQFDYDEHMICFICKTKYSCDMDNNKTRLHLPILSQSQTKDCDHYFCLGCVRNQQAALATGNRVPKWIPCMKCQTKTAFCPESPKYHRMLIGQLKQSKWIDAPVVPVKEELLD